jgi:hypothetical protein
MILIAGSRHPIRMSATSMFCLATLSLVDAPSPGFFRAGFRRLGNAACAPRGRGEVLSSQSRRLTVKDLRQSHLGA